MLCLEVAEHIPRPYEETFLANLHGHNRRGIVLSWSDNPGGNGHVNIRDNAWVVRRLEAMGYAHDPKGEAALRRGVTDIHWFRSTLMVFRRHETNPAPSGAAGPVEARAG